MTTRQHPHCDCGPMALCQKCAPTPMTREQAKADAERHIKGIIVPLTPDEEQDMEDPLADWERELMAEQIAATYNENGDVMADVKYIPAEGEAFTGILSVVEHADDPVNHPSHYSSAGGFEAINVIEAWNLGFCLGNTVKYIARAGKKPGNSELQDLKKAHWYLERRIAQIEQGAEAGYGG